LCYNRLIDWEFAQSVMTADSITAYRLNQVRDSLTDKEMK